MVAGQSESKAGRLSEVNEEQPTMNSATPFRLKLFFWGGGVGGHTHTHRQMQTHTQHNAAVVFMISLAGSSSKHRECAGTGSESALNDI